MQSQKPLRSTSRQGMIKLFISERLTQSEKGLKEMTKDEIKANAPDGYAQIAPLKALDNTDLLNEVKFHKSRKKYKEIMKGSKLSGFKLKPLS